MTEEDVEGTRREPLVYLNGALIPEREARISIDDRGFLFADGVYEVVRVYGGRLFAWERHRERLAASLAGVRLAGVDLAELDRAAQELLRAFGPRDGSLYIEVTRGVQPRAHLFPPAGTPPTVLMWIRPAASPPASVVEAGVALITTPDDRWAKVWVKTVGLLPNVLAKQAAVDAGAYDAVFVRDGMVTEATSANIFLVKDGRLRTAPVTNYILPGVTRAVVLELAAEAGYAVDLLPFTPAEAYAADELFLTGTLTEVLPVTRLDGRPIGRGVPGPVTRDLLDRFRRRAGTAPVGASS
ncbi:D-alanine aminotransferase [Candidatus Hydrogenisulfobacillus filiaventi]|uniref:D-alanine aminotransferase n=1 Tax=Candidatus Hydrogenisulfobacillus filiaventi TaxID=2707344 RepID=A0A6F8ZFU0_9FIRM|nr:D-amino acid aminotransferase [Bacillota bacterium]CAB1128503.1 D-alanine aminotransferase [Candidatus Hydrogenisulfobacillus filiaventi]